MARSWSRGITQQKEVFKLEDDMKVRYDTPMGGYVIAEATLEYWQGDPQLRVVLRVIASECFIDVGTVMPFIGDGEVIRSFPELFMHKGWSIVE
jgi:hypothetical protein